MDLHLYATGPLPDFHPDINGDSNASSTSEADVSSLLDGADQRSHHLLKHCLSHGQRDGALAHFTTGDVKEAAREVSRMGQRELQARFKAVYGTTTHSNNNDWLRRKLYEAIGAAPMKAAVKSKPRKAAAKARSRGGSSQPTSPAKGGQPRGNPAGFATQRSCPGTPGGAGQTLMGLHPSKLSFAEEGSEEGSYSYAPSHLAKAASAGDATPQSVLGMACAQLPERSSWSHNGLVGPVLAPAAPAELPDYGVFADVGAEWAAEGLDMEALRPLGGGYGDAADDDVMLLQLDLSVFE